MNKYVIVKPGDSKNELKFLCWVGSWEDADYQFISEEYFRIVLKLAPEYAVDNNDHQCIFSCSASANQLAKMLKLQAGYKVVIYDIAKMEINPCIITEVNGSPVQSADMTDTEFCIENPLDNKCYSYRMSVNKLGFTELVLLGEYDNQNTHSINSRR